MRARRGWTIQDSRRQCHRRLQQEGLWCRTSDGDENGSSPHAAEVQRRDSSTDAHWLIRGLCRTSSTCLTDESAYPPYHRIEVMTVVAQVCTARRAGRTLMARTTLEFTATFVSLTVQKHRDFTRRGRFLGDGRHRDRTISTLKFSETVCAFFAVVSFRCDETFRSTFASSFSGIIGFTSCSPRLRQIWLATLTFEHGSTGPLRTWHPGCLVPCTSGRTTASFHQTSHCVEGCSYVVAVFSSSQVSLGNCWSSLGLRSALGVGNSSALLGDLRSSSRFLHDFLAVHPRR